MYACRNGWLDCVRTLLSFKEIDVNVRDHDGNSAVVIALEKGHPGIASLLRHDSRYHEIQSKDPLLLAINSGSIEFLKDILEDSNMKLNFNGKSEEKKQGISPIIAAVTSYKKQSKEIFRMIFNDPRCDVTATSDNGYNALILSCVRNDIELAGLLLETNKFDVNYQANDGVNALIATLLDKPSDRTLGVLELLLKQDKIDPTKPCQPKSKSAMNSELAGKTVLDYCVLKTYKPGLELLLKRKDMMQSGYVVTEAMVTGSELSD